MAGIMHQLDIVIAEFAVHIGSSIFTLDYEVLAQISILTEM